METKELVTLLENPTKQLELYDRAKAGDSQAIDDFVRLSVLRKIYQNDSIEIKDKLNAYEAIMNLVRLEVIVNKEKYNG